MVMTWFILVESWEMWDQEPWKLDHSPGELLRLRVTLRRLPGLSASCYPGVAASARQSVSGVYWERASDVNQ